MPHRKVTTQQGLLYHEKTDIGQKSHGPQTQGEDGAQGVRQAGDGRGAQTGIGHQRYPQGTDQQCHGEARITFAQHRFVNSHFHSENSDHVHTQRGTPAMKPRGAPSPPTCRSFRRRSGRQGKGTLSKRRPPRATSRRLSEENRKATAPLPARHKLEPGSGKNRKKKRCCRNYADATKSSAAVLRTPLSAVKG